MPRALPQGSALTSLLVASIRKQDGRLIRRTIATLAQKKGGVKDVQGMLRHSRAATTTDVYMQEIPAGGEALIEAVNPELRQPQLVAAG